MEGEGGAVHAKGKEPLLVIMGPTAVGKTRLALGLARRLSGEIISADSAQVYRYMDIGTDKPDAATLAAIPHHLVSIRDPDEEFSVADFQRLAQAAIADIAARGRIPIMAGGTGLYIRAVVRGYVFPAGGRDPDLRRRLQAEAEEAGAAALHRRLATLDPEAAARIDARNVRRVVRALEVVLRTGVPISRWQVLTAGTGPYDALLIGLTRDRDDLYRRIEARVEDQLQRGLVEEVRRLVDRGYHPGLPAMQALGYKEVAAHLTGAYPYEEMVRVLKRNTRRYAKRQWTWFRRESGVIWFNLSEEDEEAVITAICRLAAERWGRAP